MLSYLVELLQPLFRREGIDQRFKTGLEASEMLLLEAHRKDPHSEEFLEVCVCHNQ
jgi:glutamate dehydrogenase (NADP+)